MATLTVTKYQADSGSIHSLSLTAPFAAAAGAAPSGDVDDDVKPKITKSKREYGLKPRGVRLARVIGTGDETFKVYSFLPVLTPAVFASATFSLGADVTLGGNTWTVVSKDAEDYN